MRILILDGHSSAAIETLQSLGRRGAEIDVACEADDCIAFHSRYVSARLKQPPLEPLARATEWLRARCSERAYDLVVPSTDASIVLLRHLDEQDPVRLKAVLPSNAALDIAVDKQATLRLGQQLGIRVPATSIIEQGAPIPPCAGYPVILKSVRSRVVIGGENRRIDTELARSPAERERVLASLLPHTPVQQQAFVSGHGFGIEMLFDRGRLLWHFTHERIHEMPLTGGGSCYRRSIAAPPEMLAGAERMLRSLEWHGVAMVEFRGDDEGNWYLMEINPRLWGSLALPIDSGVDFPWGLALLARGEPVPPQPDYAIGYYSRQVLHDLNWQKLNLRADHSDPLLLTRPRLRSALEYLRPLLGSESWDHFDRRDLAVTMQVLSRVVRAELGRVAARLTARRRRRKIFASHRRITQKLAGGGRPPRILFLCYGNICRSPVAAAMAGASLAGVEIRSAGFHRVAERSTPEHVRRAASRAGCDMTRHASRRVSPDDIRTADLIVCMDAENLEHLQREFPEAMARATLLGLFAAPPCLEIEDPYSLTEERTDGVMSAIRAGIDGLARRLQDYLRVTPTSASGSQVASSGNTVISAMQSTIMKKKGSEASAT